MSLLDSTSSLPSNSSNNNSSTNQTNTESPHNDTNTPSTSLSDPTQPVSKDANHSTTLSLRLSDSVPAATTTTTAPQGSGLETSLIAGSNSSTSNSIATNMTGLLISNQSNSSTTATSDVRPLQG